MAFSLKGIGSGLKGAFQNEDFVNAMAGMQGSGGDDIFSKIMGGLGKGAGMAQQFRKAQHAKANSMTPPTLGGSSGVPLAGPMGGAPPGVGDASIPGMPDMSPAPPPAAITPPPPAPMTNSGDMSAGESPTPLWGGEAEEADPMKDYLKKDLRSGAMGY